MKFCSGLWCAACCIWNGLFQRISSADVLCWFRSLRVFSKVWSLMTLTVNALTVSLRIRWGKTDILWLQKESGLPRPSRWCGQSVRCLNFSLAKIFIMKRCRFLETEAFYCKSAYRQFQFPLFAPVKGLSASFKYFWW